MTSSLDSPELARLVEWKAYVKHFLSYFEALSSHESSSSSAIAKMIQKSSKFQPPFDAQSRLSHIYLDHSNYQQAARDAHTENSQVYKSIGKQLFTLKKQIKKMIADLTSLEAKNIREIKSDTDILHEHSRDLNDALIAVKSDSSGKDPWMMKHILDHANALAERRQAERVNQSQHSQSEYKSFEAKIIESFKLSLNELSTARSSDANAMGAAMKQSLMNLSATQEHELFQAKRATGSLSDEISVPKFTHGTSDPTTATIHEGILFRPKSILSGFTSAYAVLTASGYLYIFDEQLNPAKSIPKPIHSHRLAECTVSPSLDAKEDEFLVVDVHNGKGKNHPYKSACAADCTEWIRLVSAFAKNIMVDASNQLPPVLLSVLSSEEAAPLDKENDVVSGGIDALHIDATTSTIIDPLSPATSDNVSAELQKKKILIDAAAASEKSGDTLASAELDEQPKTEKIKRKFSLFGKNR